MIKESRLMKILAMVKKEFINATEKFGKFNSYHEGYAILLEEIDELGLKSEDIIMVD